MSSTGPVIVEPVPQTRRSVFGNYQPVAAEGPASLSPPAAAINPAAAGPSIALARSFIHQFLARALDYPAMDTWLWLCQAGVQAELCCAVRSVEADGACAAALKELLPALQPGAFETFHDDYITAIGHAARGSCPINEIEYGDLKADPLFQPHRLADLAAFYRAFGMELGPIADERHDHLSVELEFMGVLAAREAHLARVGAPPDALVVGHDAQRKFLREHLGRWTPAFARRLQRAVGAGALGQLALFTLAFIEHECRRYSVTPGSEDLLLRPADEGAALCEGCGIKQPLPGATMSA